jgi:hypothetical protein
VPGDAPAIVALMKEAGLQPHVQLEHLQWKYWRERPDWCGPRSYVLTDGQELVAHCAIVPGTLRSEKGEASVVHLIDWAARRSVAGAGILLMMHVARSSDFLLGIGGSRDTLAIMPKLGYQSCGMVTGYVRTLAPLGILKRPVPSSWKLLPRIARSTYWTIAAPRCELAGWEVRRIRTGEVERVCGAFPAPRPGLAVLGRNVEVLRHALLCPIVPVELYALERARKVGGYFLLSYAPGQARLVDCWMNSGDPADWRAVIHGAVQQARHRGGVAELTAWSSDPTLDSVLSECGCHARMTLPLYLRHSRREPISAETVRVQMLDDDAFYLYFGGNALWA